LTVVQHVARRVVNLIYPNILHPTAQKRDLEHPSF
jgi:hypothetical protein